MKLRSTHLLPALLSGALLFLSNFAQAAQAPEQTSEQIRVAVASNFLAPLSRLQAIYEQESGNQLLISSGSTGSLYAQIQHGAPYDLFLAADLERPQQLAQQEAVAEPFIYACGVLALWNPQGLPQTTELAALLGPDNFRRLALANPRLAPYGLAAQQTLESLGLQENLADKLVFGENIGQTYAMIASRNADLGFVALSQLLSKSAEDDAIAANDNSRWQVIPQQHYAPILQAAVVLTDNAATAHFVDFLQSPAAKQMIMASGYGQCDG